MPSLPSLGDQADTAVTITHLSRVFGVVRALDDVSMEIAAGKITTLLGENGAGKSTLLKILAGLQPPSDGSVTIFGEPVTSFDPHTLLTKHKVAIVPQELTLLPDRTIAENVLTGIEPGGRLFPSRRAMAKRTREVLAQLQLDLDPNTPVSELDLATQQLVVVARSLARECRVLVLDEPTAMLTPRESERLFAVMRQLRDEGTTLIYVSHRIPEVFDLSDRLEILRDGRHIGSGDVKDTTPDAAIAAMVGRDLAGVTPRTEMSSDLHAGATPAIAVRGLSGRRHQDVTFSVAPGEILGIAGLPDSGRVELLRNIFGADPGSGGEVAIAGKPYSRRDPMSSVRHRMAFVPGERRREGILATLSVGDNIGVLRMPSRTTAGFVRRRTLTRESADLARKMSVKTAGLSVPITNLSGGNQQKVILARWLSIAPKVIVLDDPTRGIDVGAKAEIYSQLFELADAGVGIICSSSDLPELLTVSNRIAVMSEGRLAGILPGNGATEESIMALATASNSGRAPAGTHA